MHFLVDAQLPPALARWLTARGHPSEHVADIGMTATDDRAIWQYAAAAGAIVITKDEDFARRRVMLQDGPTIVWVRVGNTTRRELLDWFQFRLAIILEALSRGETLVEII